MTIVLLKIASKGGHENQDFRKRTSRKSSTSPTRDSGLRRSCLAQNVNAEIAGKCTLEVIEAILEAEISKHLYRGKDRRML